MTTKEYGCATTGCKERVDVTFKGEYYCQVCFNALTSYIIHSYPQHEPTDEQQQMAPTGHTEEW